MPTYFAVHGRVRVAVTGLLVCAMVLGACSGTEHSSDAFCEQLGFVTGPDGAEVTIVPGDPNRVGAVMAELRVLLDRAPDDIVTTVRTLLDFFDDYQLAARDERRELIAERGDELRQAADRLNAYAVDECGLFLQRAEPTSVQTFDPGVEVAPE